MCGSPQVSISLSFFSQVAAGGNKASSASPSLSSLSSSSTSSSSLSSSSLSSFSRLPTRDWHFGFETSRFRNFCQFFEGIGFGFGKFGIGKKVSVSVSENLVSEKKSRYRFRSKFWYRHSVVSRYENQMNPTQCTVQVCFWAMVFILLTFFFIRGLKSPSFSHHVCIEFRESHFMSQFPWGP